MKLNVLNPEQIVLQFNEYITKHDVESLANLMTDNHRLTDRDGNIGEGKENMIAGWNIFFKMFPDYKNTFTEIKSDGELVIIKGYAYWSEENQHDDVIWTAKIENGLIAEWKIYYDTEENRKRFGI